MNDYDIIDDFIQYVQPNLSFTKYLHKIGHNPDPQDADVYLDLVLKHDDVKSFQYMFDHGIMDMKDDDGKVNEGIIFSIISYDSIEIFKTIYDRKDEDFTDSNRSYFVTNY